ncbi:hypothetical protein B0H17DRAFT_1147407 [Mycena rosella]|uniref:Uncharacterized protein n=1 Tax=Mycena rosella TaxID=1033263 RepID=A0AAD7CMH1_MYCRO|nr:hypothetical protein B0H17DRAFT_1147407 [Mycena rosella]
MTTQEDIEFIWILEDGVRAQDPLMYPPWHMDLHTNTKYHKLVDILGNNGTQKLMKKVKHDNREEPLYVGTNLVFRLQSSWISCLQRWHDKKEFITCPTCRVAMHVVHKDWVLISPEQLQRNKDIKQKKRAAKMKVLAHTKKQALLVLLQEQLHKQRTHLSSSLGASNLSSE